MGPQKDTEVLASEVQKEAYLSRLPKADRANLQLIGERFMEIMEEEKRKGALVVVGGILDKPLPRKDIDLLIVLQPHFDDTQKGTSTELDFALRDFETFKHLAEKIAQGANLTIKEVIAPCMDEEFNSPSILKSDGSIVIESEEEGLIPVEFIRTSKRGSYDEVAGKDSRPFVILETA